MKNKSIEDSVNNEYMQILKKEEDIIKMLDGMSYYQAKSVIDSVNIKLLQHSIISTKRP